MLVISLVYIYMRSISLFLTLALPQTLAIARISYSSWDVTITVNQFAMYMRAYMNILNFVHMSLFCVVNL